MKLSASLLGTAASAAVVCLSTFADGLEAKFSNPPESSRLQTWFHWNADCVTKDGLVADLKAMGDMDIGTAHVFMPGMANLPVTAKPLTPEWFELWQTAIREARKNNIKLGFHNCPGWSSSGGPWITPENSMKMLVAGETDFDPATGAKEIKLAQPITIRDFYRDVSVVAFPIRRTPKLVKVTGDFSSDFAAFREGKGTISLPLGKPDAGCEFTLEYDRPLDPVAAVFLLDDSNFYADGEIAASVDGRNWTRCAKIFYEVFNAQRTPKVINVSGEAKGARFFRVRLHGRACPPWVRMRDRVLKSFAITEQVRVADIDTKNSASTTFGYKAPQSPETKGIAPETMIDLTKNMLSDGTLDVTSIPAKRLAGDVIWRILRIGFTTTGKQCAPATLRGLECDKLSKKGLDAHWPHMPQRLIDSPEAKGVVSISIIDSYEVGGQNWTEEFPREFRSRRGYDVMSWLPAVAGYVVGTVGETAKFLYDYQRTISDLFAENYFDYFAELCHKAGIEAAVEPYGGPFDSMRCGAGFDVPTGEFWLGSQAHGTPRVAASIGHLNGRTRIAAEAFTTEAKEGRWQITPGELRRCGDNGWLDGVSQLVYHSYLHQPFSNAKPGISLGRHGTQLNRFTTWWPEGIHWSRYVRRGQFLLQSGLPRAEVLVFVGESTPNAFHYARTLVEAGGNFDYCGAGDLQKLSVVDGGVAVQGALPYDVLFLGDDRYFTISTLRKLKELVDGGARIAGTKPIASPSLSDDAGEWKKLVDAIWSGGRIKSATDALSALKAFSRRTAFEASGILRATHRVVDGRDVFFVVNQNDGLFDGAASFAAKGVPELWEARDGTVRTLPVVKGKQEAGRVNVRLALPPHGSCFVVFNPNGKPKDFADAPVVQLCDVVVLSARYCARDDGTRGRDVTDKVRRLLLDGKTEFTVCNSLLGGDPASNHFKVLDLIYTVDGERRQARVAEYAVVSLRFPRKIAGKSEPILCDLSTGWKIVAFNGVNAPSAPRLLEKLQSWSESNDVKLKYFAGRAMYEKAVKIPSEGTRVLDLGTVRDVVNVWAGDRFLGCLWESPYRVALPNDLPEEFTLKLEVVNTWPNRLIGDAAARAAGAAEPKSSKGPWPQWVLEGKPDSGTGIYTWSNWLQGWRGTDELLPAGLIGPVRVVK